jgi:hypothetical protein
METVDPELELPAAVDELEFPAPLGAVELLFEELLHPATSAIDSAAAAARSPFRAT